MKVKIIAFFMLLACCSFMDATAQNKNKKGKGKAPKKQTVQVKEDPNVNKPPTQDPPKDTIPIEVEAPKFPWADSIIKPKRSLRAINFNTEKGINAGRSPQPFERLREDDAIQSFILWREIDTREKMNIPFRTTWKDDNGNSQTFISILMKGIMKGELVAFEDEEFTKIIDSNAIKKKFIYDTRVEEVKGREGNIEKKIQTTVVLGVDSIYKYRLMEEWVFDKRTSRLHVRLLALCPMIAVGSGPEPICWLYYPDELRNYLATFPVYNAKNNSDQFFWDQFLDMRLFSSRIYKSKLDNAFGSKIDEYINSPLSVNSPDKEKYAKILRLLEGDRIQSMIFNYEQDVWSH